jgi:haloacetate dehalogenase
MPPTIPGFTYHRVPVADGVSLNAAVSGSGSPIVLLHGFPQTHLMWRHVAADLAADHTVICPDLRGYGASDKPADRRLRLRQAHHGRRRRRPRPRARPRPLRARRARPRRAGRLPRRPRPPRHVTHLACLDVLPTLDMWDVLHGVTAAVGFHLYLMAQPPGPARGVDRRRPDAFFGHFLDLWTNDPDAIPADVRAAYLDACRAAVPSIVADYRASAGIDVDPRPGRPGRRQPAAHAGDRAPAGLGRGARLRRPPATCGDPPGPRTSRDAHVNRRRPPTPLRPLHGRGGTLCRRRPRHSPAPPDRRSRRRARARTRPAGRHPCTR